MSNVVRGFDRSRCSDQKDLWWFFMQAKTILVTGGPGFIGTSPLRELGSCSGDCFGARPAHTPENLKQRAVN